MATFGDISEISVWKLSFKITNAKTNSWHQKNVDNIKYDNNLTKKIGFHNLEDFLEIPDKRQDTWFKLSESTERSWKLNSTNQGT